MKRTIWSLIIAVVFLISGHGAAQTTVVKSDGHQTSGKNMEGNPFLLKELGALIAMDEGVIKVLNVMPPGQRPAAYKDVDLQQEDIVSMVNGKHVSGIKDIESAYNSLGVGNEFKMGIKRKEEMHLVSLKKGDPKDLPNLQMKVVHGGSDGDDVATFPAVGVALKMKGKEIVVDEMLSGETAVQKLDVKQGDTIVEMNGKHCASLQEYEDAYGAVTVGKNIQWVLRRGEKQHTVTFARPQPRMIIKQEGPKK